MIDPRNDKLADVLVNYSCAVKKNDLVYIAIRGIPSLELGKAIIRKVTKAGGIPFWYYNDDSLTRQFLLTNTVEQIKQFAKFNLSMAKKTDCYIGIYGPDNSFDLADIPAKKMDAWKLFYYKPVIANVITKKTRWVAMRLQRH